MALKPSLRAVITGLQAEEALPPEAEARALAALESRQQAAAGTPWFVRILTGFGAWVAALFLLIFLAMAVTAGGAIGAAFIGLLLCGGATLLRHVGNNVFLTQLALATGLAGQLFAIGGMAELLGSEKAAVTFTIVLEVALLLVYPDLVQRFLSALTASLALLLLLRLVSAPAVLVELTLVGLTVLAHLLFLHQGRLQHGRWGELVTPAAFGFITTLFFALLLRTWFHDVYDDLTHKTSAELPPGVLTLGLAAVTLYTAWRILQELGLETRDAAGVTLLGALVLVALLTLQTPGIIAAIGVLALGFHRRNVVLLGLAVVFVLTFGVGYYYSLQLTLLAKSLALLGSGLVLLGLRLFILRRFPVAEEVP